MSEHPGEEEDHHALTKMGAALTILSTTIGGGIVALPSAFYQTGLILGPSLVVIMAVQTTFSSVIYLEAKDLIPGKPESLFEIGYVLFKRPSIFGVCGIIIFNSFGLMLVYFIIFGDTFKTIIRNLTTTDAHHFFGQRGAYVIVICALLMPLVLKKELQELAIITYILFFSLFVFIVLTIV